jgi:hypothetical protein
MKHVGFSPLSLLVPMSFLGMGPISDKPPGHRQFLERSVSADVALSEKSPHLGGVLVKLSLIEVIRDLAR